MKHILILILLTSNSHTSTETKNDSIIGTWSYVETVDLRTEKEKAKAWEVIPSQPMIYGYPKLTLFSNGTFKKYQNPDWVDSGKWELKNHKLILSEKMWIENKLEEVVNVYELKSITENTLELGTQNLYDIYKKIK
ncbi:hypothetical protein LRR18_16320 [Mangrovimonas sp. AS39]|uniref:hypothetical protein n=1 Tax=Mangrovimonas futianensis TaxID=2895523 RepID=UPI001E283F70|nr:hypothetical protein [Mangrovimonas futianensis]MCF1193155.1 hypothetical protein [Mangrovimonas futianensis]MCF1196829.1 hypothetical protein [Mangrovimonas futianensis]